MLGIDIIKRLGGGGGSSGGGGGGGGGGTSGTVSVNNDSVISTTTSIWVISDDGYTYKEKGAGRTRTQAQTWISPRIGMNQYEVRATSIGTDVPPGTIGSWLDLALEWGWGWGDEFTTKNGQLTVEIRRKSDSVIVDTFTITINLVGIE